jgi:hypothetical protein
VLLPVFIASGRGDDDSSSTSSYCDRLEVASAEVKLLGREVDAMVETMTSRRAAQFVSDLSRVYGTLVDDAPPEIANELVEVRDHYSSAATRLSGMDGDLPADLADDVFRADLLSAPSERLASYRHEKCPSG